jgi:hypothetical protein
VKWAEYHTQPHYGFMPRTSTTQTIRELFTEICKNVCLQKSCLCDPFTDYTQVCGSLDGGQLIEKPESNLGKYDSPHNKYLITTSVQGMALFLSVQLR